MLYILYGFGRKKNMSGNECVVDRASPNMPIGVIETKNGGRLGLEASNGRKQKYSQKYSQKILRKNFL